MAYTIRIITEACDSRFFVFSDGHDISSIGTKFHMWMWPWDIHLLLVNIFGLFGKGYFLYIDMKWSSDFLNEVEKYCILIKIKKETRGDRLTKSRIPSLSWVFDDENSQLYFHNKEDAAIAKLLL